MTATEEIIQTTHKGENLSAFGFFLIVGNVYVLHDLIYIAQNSHAVFAELGALTDLVPIVLLNAIFLILSLMRFADKSQNAPSRIIFTICVVSLISMIPFCFWIFLS